MKDFNVDNKMFNKYINVAHIHCGHYYVDQLSNSVNPND